MRVSPLPTLLAALFALAAAACSSPAASSAPVAVTPAGIGPGTLVPPLPPVGAEVLPLLVAQAQGVFMDGAAAYAAGNYGEAAARFLAVADAMRPAAGAPDEPYRVGNRLLAYRNAALARLAGNEPEVARAELDKAALDDPPCAEGISEILLLLPPSEPSAAPVAPAAPEPSPAVEATASPGPPSPSPPSSGRRRALVTLASDAARYVTAAPRARLRGRDPPAGRVRSRPVGRFTGAEHAGSELRRGPRGQAWTLSRQTAYLLAGRGQIRSRISRRYPRT
jgi:hypothetical protein